MPPRVIKGSPIILDLSEAGGGQLLVGNNTNDNKVFLQGMSANGQANASELLVTGRLITSLPLVSGKRAWWKPGCWVRPSVVVCRPESTWVSRRRLM